MLLKLFRFLMPRDEVFVPFFAAHAARGAEAAVVFRQVLAALDAPVFHPDGQSRVAHRLDVELSDAEYASARRRYADLCDVEHAADVITRNTSQAIHRVFVTPFDRSDILLLSTALDDVIDLMKAAAQRILLYRVAVTPEMLTMAGCIVLACNQLRDGMPLLGNVARNAEQLKEMCLSVRRIERDADDALAAGLQALFSESLPTGDRLTVERVYDLIEAVVDRCEDLVDVVEGIVIEQV